MSNKFNIQVFFNSAFFSLLLHFDITVPFVYSVYLGKRSTLQTIALARLLKNIFEDIYLFVAFQDNIYWYSVHTQAFKFLTNLLHDATIPIISDSSHNMTSVALLKHWCIDVLIFEQLFAFCFPGIVFSRDLVNIFCSLLPDS